MSAARLEGALSKEYPDEKEYKARAVTLINGLKKLEVTRYSIFVTLLISSV